MMSILTGPCLTCVSDVSHLHRVMLCVDTGSSQGTSDAGDWNRPLSCARRQGSTQQRSSLQLQQVCVAFCSTRLCTSASAHTHWLQVWLLLFSGRPHLQCLLFFAALERLIVLACAWPPAHCLHHASSIKRLALCVCVCVCVCAHHLIATRCTRRGDTVRTRSRRLLGQARAAWCAWNRGCCGEAGVG
jgi:hypothetical protein